MHHQANHAPDEAGERPRLQQDMLIENPSSEGLRGHDQDVPGRSEHDRDSLDIRGSNDLALWRSNLTLPRGVHRRSRGTTMMRKGLLACHRTGSASPPARAWEQRCVCAERQPLRAVTGFLPFAHTAQSGIFPGTVHNQQRPRNLSQHAFGDGAKDEAAKAAATVATHDNQITRFAFGDFNDSLCGIGRASHLDASRNTGFPCLSFGGRQRVTPGAPDGFQVGLEVRHRRNAGVSRRCNRLDDVEEDYLRSC